MMDRLIVNLELLGWNWWVRLGRTRIGNPFLVCWAWESEWHMQTRVTPTKTENEGDRLGQRSSWGREPRSGSEQVGALAQWVWAQMGLRLCRGISEQVGGASGQERCKIHCWGSWASSHNALHGQGAWSSHQKPVQILPEMWVNRTRWWETHT